MPNVLAPAVRGDVNDRRVVRLDGVANLGAVVGVEAHVWRSGVSPVALAATVVDATERTVDVVLGAADGWLATATPGTWWVEIEATFADGSVLSWPAQQPLSITVRPDADPP